MKRLRSISNQACVLRHDHGRTPGHVFHERHLPKDPARPHSLQDHSIDNDVHGTPSNGKHVFARLALPKDGLAGWEWLNFGVVAEKCDLHL